MQLGSFFALGETMYSPILFSMGGPYRGKLLEFCESVLAQEKDNPAPQLADI